MNLFPIIRTWLLSNSWIASFLYFYKANYNGNEEPNGSGSLVKAPFSRAATSEDGAKSGSLRYNGTIYENVGINEPVISKLPYRLFSCDALVLLPSYSNLVDDSEDTTTWDVGEVTITPNAGISPITGTNIAGKIIPTTTLTNHFAACGTVAAMTIGNIYSGSYFVKADGYNIVQITPSTGFNGIYWANFDLVNGIMLNNNLGGNYKAGIESLENDWYHVWMTGDASAALANGRFLLTPLASDENSRFPAFSGDGVSGILATGAQVNDGQYYGPLSYLPTTTLTLTRQIDAINNWDVSGEINAGSGIWGIQILDVQEGLNVNNYLRIDGLSDTLRYTFANGNLVILYDYGTGTLGTTQSEPLGKHLMKWDGATNSLKVFSNGFILYDITTTDSFDVDTMRSNCNGYLALKEMQIQQNLPTDDECLTVVSWDDFDTMATELNFS